VTTHIVASTLAAAALGALLGAIGAAVNMTRADGWRVAALLVVLAAALALELSGRRLPGPRRQVDERWLDEYRSWVYGAGYGAQLGLGLTTVVVSGAVYAALAAALLSGSTLAGALIFGTFGLARGATVLSTAHVDNPARLRRLHTRVSSSATTVARATVALELGLLTVLVVVLIAP
jgi:sulfite exporter TauE/SafE